MTFSLAVVDPVHGLIGATTASRSLAVGNAVMVLDPARGVSISQAATNRDLHALLLHGVDPAGTGEDPADDSAPARALRTALGTDDQPEIRQCGVLDLTGRGAAHTGSSTVGWAGHVLHETADITTTGPHRAMHRASRPGPSVHASPQPAFLALGNLLTGPEVLDAMASTIRSPGSGEELAHSLVEALVAGDEAGGDFRGRQSAAVMVARIDPGATWPFLSVVDLRVDDDPQAPAVLQSLMAKWIENAAERRRVGRR